MVIGRRKGGGRGGKEERAIIGDKKRLYSGRWAHDAVY